MHAVELPDSFSYLWGLHVLYNLNILREKIFADFELPRKKLFFRLKLITCGTYVWLVFCPDVLL